MKRSCSSPGDQTAPCTGMAFSQLWVDSVTSKNRTGKRFPRRWNMS
jgi:hypothetical protein